MALWLKITAISDLIRLRKQHGTWLLVLPALWSLFMASGGAPAYKHLLIFIFGAFFMRSAGCVINDIADRDFDKLVERTKDRPLADNRLGLKEAAVVFIVLLFLSFVLVSFLDRFTIKLSFVGLVLAALYPFIKRVSFFPQVFLGAAFGWGAIMAWSAVRETVGAPAILIFIANVFWSFSYDTIYAMMDKEDDLKIGVKSTAIYFGKSVYMAIGVSYVLMALTLAAAGISIGAGVVYYGGVIGSFVFFLTVLGRVKKNPVRQGFFKGFTANASGGTSILLSIILDRNL